MNLNNEISIFEKYIYRFLSRFYDHEALIEKSINSLKVSSCIKFVLFIFICGFQLYFISSYIKKENIYSTVI